MSPSSWYLLVYGTQGRCLVREVDGEITIGRTRSDLNLPSPNVSKRQCVFTRKKDGLWIVDRSVSGTYLNDRKLGPSATRLQVGDRIRVGDSRIVVDDRYPGAWVAQDVLPEHGAPVGSRIVVGDWGSTVDFVMPKGRAQQGRAWAEILRTKTGWALGTKLDAALVEGPLMQRAVDPPADRPVDRLADRPVDRLADRPVDRLAHRPVDRLADRDRIRVGDRGVLRFHLGPPLAEPEHTIFRESPLASLAELLVSPDSAYREQGLTLLDALLSSEHGAGVLQRLSLSDPVGPSFSHQVRPPRLRLEDEGLVGPLRSAFEMIALHLLAASDHPLRNEIESLWVGFVAPPPWWARKDVAESPPRLDVDLGPLAALPNLRHLVVENAVRLRGPALPSVRSVRLLGCDEIGDYKALFPNVVRWDAHRPIGFAAKTS